MNVDPELREAIRIIKDRLRQDIHLLGEEEEALTRFVLEAEEMELEEELSGPVAPAVHA